jgi:phosphoglycolate phosphatase
MSYHAIVFDLDGTLLDTLDDIADSANTVLAEHGYPPHSADDYRFFIGGGVDILFERALPESERNAEAIRACVERFRDVYRGGWDVKTRIYDGASQLLDGLVKRGLKLAILSNKPHAFVGKCVTRYLSRWTFSPILGQRDGVPHKPDPTGAQEIADELGIAPAEFLYLGDSATDMKTARAAGMFAVGALWGFRPEKEMRDAGAQTLIATPTDLLELVD